MSQLARFTFDLDLESRPVHGEAANDPPPPPMPSLPENVVAQLIASAREEAYAEGLAAGERNAANMAAQTIAAAAGALATQTAPLAAALDRAIAEHRREAVDLALSIARKLALHLVARYPQLELEALIAECLASLGGVPHLVIRCHPDLADAIRDKASAHMAQSGFSGRLVVMGEPDIRLGDGRLEWVDGGVVRDIAETAGEIDRQIASYLAARGRADHEEYGA
ncbi:FliH/SctL family protein [Devosia sp. YIM 151766]|uniref:FliH/SctL family protein n=1 Tax=Devosia sp. YIM 151766 TaxID=3017325 RepID=UPI00255CE3B8|nr:FliH/SctL family protein [Devosia sp. YIM 151766]WIY52264.1 FliH/SctL family protein [Devosia sp. YIM 151766]